MTVRHVTIWMVCGALVALCGCSHGAQRSFSRQRALHAPKETDVIQVVTYWKNNPFVSLDPAGDPNPEGFRFVYYAVSARTNKGVNADGTIRIKLYTIDREASGEAYGEHVKTWEFDYDAAQQWRVGRKSKFLGWPYMFQLDWGDSDLCAKEIRIVPEFVRTDGAVITGHPHNFKVPECVEGIKIRPPNA